MIENRQSLLFFWERVKINERKIIKSKKQTQLVACTVELFLCEDQNNVRRDMSIFYRCSFAKKEHYQMSKFQMGYIKVTNFFFLHTKI